MSDTLIKASELKDGREEALACSTFAAATRRATKRMSMTRERVIEAQAFGGGQLRELEDPDLIRPKDNVHFKK